MPDRHTLRCSHTMAVRADHLALGDLAHRRRNALGVADVHRLAVANVIEVQCDRMGSVPAVSAAVLHLVGVNPVANGNRPIISKAVLPFPVSRLFQSLFTPLTRLVRLMSALGSGSLSASRRAEPGFSLCIEGNTAGGASELSGCGVFPRRHKQMLPEMFYPCKPDIFATTYEAAE